MPTYANIIEIAHPGEQYIDGKWTPARGGRAADVIDPSTEERYEGFVLGGVDDADAAIGSARKAFDAGKWSSTEPAERGKLLAKVADLLEARRQELEVAWGAQTGAIVAARERAINNGINHMRRAAEAAQNHIPEKRASSTVGDAVIREEPIGVVVAIAAWNGTLLQSTSKIGPALAAGCTVIFKPAPNTPIEAKIIAECFEQAGVPAGVLNVVLLTDEAADKLIADPRVDKVAFTGSTNVGRHIATTMGGRIGRYSLELGGKSAAIVLDDADVGAVGKQMARTITALSGQLCCMLSRLVVTKDRHDELADAIAAEMAKVKQGNAHDPASEMGPMALERQLHSVEAKVAQGKAEGATLAYGGGRPAHLYKGFFHEPTLFTNVDPSGNLAQQEIFGPVLALIKAEDEEDAIAIANNSIYGLHGAVFTPDKERALAVARRVRTGTFAQNGMKLDFSLPFGGYKSSGIGREGGEDAIREYLEIKTIILDA